MHDRNTRISNKRHTSLPTFKEEAHFYSLESFRDFQSLSHVLTEGCGYTIQFIPQPDPLLHAIEEELFIAPVAVLQNDEDASMSWGVFAKQDFIFHGERRLGKYLGEMKRSTKNKKHTQDFNYTFEFDDGMVIDAKYQRGWPAMVNSASCYEAANVLAKKVGNDVYYYLYRSIKAGEQLLVYYGDEYTCKNKRFLNSTDNWQTSSARQQQYQSIYTVQESHDEAFLALFKLKRNKFAIPAPITADIYISIDTPILAYKTARELLPQSQQENITLLMLACWRGDFAEVKNLLTLGANPYQQTSIRGYSCLHLLIYSPHSNAQQKMEILDHIWQQAGAILKLQDWHDETILHLAIRSKQIKLVEHILKRDAAVSRYGEHKSVRDCLNKDDLDVFEAALVSLDIVMIQKVLFYWRVEDIDCLLDNPTEFKQVFKKCLQEYSAPKVNEHLNKVIQQIKNLHISNPHKHALTALFKTFMPTQPKVETNKLSGSKRSRHDFFPEEGVSYQAKKARQIAKGKCLSF